MIIVIKIQFDPKIKDFGPNFPINPDRVREVIETPMRSGMRGVHMNLEA